MKPFDKSAFWFLLFGTDETTFILVGMIMALLGAVISILGRALKGMKQNPNTPTTFDWKYLIADKWLQFLLGILCTFAAMRFSVELTGTTLTMWLSFVYGFLNYRLGNIIGGMIYALYDRWKYVQDKVRGFSFRNVFKKKEK